MGKVVVAAKQDIAIKTLCHKAGTAGTDVGLEGFRQIVIIIGSFHLIEIAFFINSFNRFDGFDLFFILKINMRVHSADSSLLGDRFLEFLIGIDTDTDHKHQQAD